MVPLNALIFDPLHVQFISSPNFPKFWILSGQWLENNVLCKERKLSKVKERFPTSLKLTLEVLYVMNDFDISTDASLIPEW